MTERSDNDRKGVTPDEIKAASTDPKRVTPEEARDLADKMHPQGQAYEAKVLRSLAGQVEKLTEQYRLSHIDWVNTEKELAEARATIEAARDRAKSAEELSMHMSRECAKYKAERDAAVAYQEEKAKGFVDLLAWCAEYFRRTGGDPTKIDEALAKLSALLGEK